MLDKVELIPDIGAMRTMTLDIETVPIPIDELTETAKRELYRKAEIELARKPDSTLEDNLCLIGGTNPYFGKIVCIGLHLDGSGGPEQSVEIIGDEKYILEMFWKNLAHFSGLFVHYNGLSFDVPFILRRSMFHGIPPTNKQFLNLRRFSTSPHFDVKEVVSNYNYSAAVTLELLCDFLNIPNPKEGEVKASEVAQAFADGRIAEIAKYCGRDVKATFEAYKKVKAYA